MTQEQNNDEAPDEGLARVDALTKEILNEDYLRFSLGSVEVSEPKPGEVAVRVVLERSSDGRALEIKGAGVGVVDAFFHGMNDAFAEEFPSLKTISVVDFGVSTVFENAQGQRSDAEALAELKLSNSDEIVFRFTSRSPSVTRSSVQASVNAFTFFMNSERAYIRIHHALLDAKQRRRSDLVERYRGQMGVLVDATSYSEVIQRLRSST